MNIHEYQGKLVLKSFDVPVPRGGVAFTSDEAVCVAKELGGSVWVVKAQIHAGGRGKGGGVKVVTSLKDVRVEAERMLGMTLVTHQTGEEGKKVGRIYVEEGVDIARELYVSLLVDRATSRISFVTSTEGGMDIEEVAHKTPDRIVTLSIDPVSGFSDHHGRRLAFSLGFTGEQVKQVAKLFSNLYKAFLAKDMGLLEINPLIVTVAGAIVCLDTKMSFDSNALYRHPDIVEYRDLSEENLSEIEASKFDLSYVKLNGTIGCMVNGAGLAMATMDIIKLYGSEPANFLDVGGGATKEKVTEAFKLILSDTNVEGILVNIFGGIMRCDIIAEGVITAATELDLSVPLVVRLEGTNVALGQEIMQNSDLDIITADHLDDAAEKIVEAVRRVR